MFIFIRFGIFFKTICQKALLKCSFVLWFLLFIFSSLPILHSFALWEVYMTELKVEFVFRPPGFSSWVFQKPWKFTDKCRGYEVTGKEAKPKQFALCCTHEARTQAYVVSLRTCKTWVWGRNAFRACSQLLSRDLLAWMRSKRLTFRK